jgi:L-2-hydroxyglutarate oxidase
VIHAGIYYRPGSLKARLAREGNESMSRFCDAHSIPWRRCGKLIVAADEEEIPRLEALYARGVENGLTLERMTPDEARKIEPHVRCAAAIHVPATGVVDFRQVCARMAEIVASRGCDLLLGSRVLRIERGRITTARGTMESGFTIACAGLQGDRVARLGGVSPPARMVPFRGDYFTLAPRSASLVKGLIYPLPDPAFPFLGVHLTRAVDDTVHAGPNAVLSLAREGYRKMDVSMRDLASTLLFPGFWRLAIRHGGAGLHEIARSVSRRLFARALQRLVPGIHEEDLHPAPAGIRAQAVRPSGDLVDDFLLVSEDRSLHVLNAPSPAATASLEIGKMIAAQVPGIH